MKIKNIIIDETPNIKGLRFRSFQGEEDFPHMVSIIDAASQADGEERATTLDDIKNDYQHLTNSDPYQDLLIAEIYGEPAAYSRVEWFQEEYPNDLIYTHFTHIKPAWRNQGLEKAMLQWSEEQLRIISKDHPKSPRHFFQTFSGDFKPDFNRILESNGYHAERFFFQMIRPLDNIPEANLHEGIEVCPVKKQQIRQIWDAHIEAFRDHWGFAEPEEKEYEGYLKSKYCQPEYWQIAWEGDQVVGGVLNYVDHDENKKYDRKRGYTEDIFTLRPWRRQGIATALIVKSMQMHKDNGMTEVALGVDTKNPNGALELYQNLGYQKTKTWITFRKPMDDH